MPKQIITVFAATGRQGSGAVQYLCEDGTFHVRAFTRNPASEGAKGMLLAYKLASSDVQISARCFRCRTRERRLR